MTSWQDGRHWKVRGEVAFTMGRKAMNSKTENHFKKVSPKGYRHTDEKLKENVCDALAQASNVNCSHIKTSVDGGVVTLRGTVEKQPMKQLVEDWVRYVAGVNDVKNELRIQSRPQASGRKR